MNTVTTMSLAHPPRNTATTTTIPSPSSPHSPTTINLDPCREQYNCSNTATTTTIPLPSSPHSPTTSNLDLCSEQQPPTNTTSSKNTRYETSTHYADQIKQSKKRLHGSNTSSDKSSPGRPKGSTILSKLTIKQKEEFVKHKIVCRYVQELKHNDFSGISKKHLFSLIFEEEKCNHDLRVGFKFPFHTANSRIRRKSYDGKGTRFPMIEIETTFIELLLVMAKLK